MKYIGLLFIALCVSSCCKDRSNLPDSIKTGYLEGVVIIRAEKKHTIGLIKLKDIFSDDKYMESPSRAILYKYNECMNDSAAVNQFDLYDKVRFKVTENNNMQFACKIVIDSLFNDSFSLALNKEDVYKVMQALDINLHNSDPHREGPQHRIWHRKPRIERINLGPYLGIYTFWNPQSTSEVSRFLINSGDEELTFDTDYYLYLSDEIPPYIGTDTLLILTDATNIYDASKSHDHTH